MPVPTGPHHVPPPRNSHQLVEDNLICNEDLTIRAAKHFAQLGNALIKLIQNTLSSSPDLCLTFNQATLYGPLQYFQDKVVNHSLTLHGVKLWNAFADGVLEIVNTHCAEKARQ
ncbi:hypothetical protein C0992_006622, partial [Termitomyces sp. T32_za158]